MPELPEVQTTVDGIQKYAKGLTIRDVWTDFNSSFHDGKDNIKNPEYFKKFRREIIGKRIVGAHRIGKNVLIDLSDSATIIVHMKMTGHILYGIYEKQAKTWVAKDAGPLRDDPFNKFIHLVLTLSNGKHLALSDMRKFARVSLEETEGLHSSEHLETHGPDALDPKLTFKGFLERLMMKPNWPIKQALMNHEVISGIGNIYSDEMLWHAGVNPMEKVKDMLPQKARALFAAMKKVLRLGMDFGGDSMSDYRNLLGESGKFQLRHEAYRRTGEKCRKRGCGGTIRRIKVSGRSAHFCDKHQKLL
jgi:formamidopyrimidine-DNA glycosylase